MRKRTAKTVDTVGNRFNPTNDYFRISLHEQTGADITISGQLDGTAFTDTVTLQGAPADTVWTADTGWFNNEGDNYTYLEAVTQVASIMTPGNYLNGGLLFLCGLKLDSGRTPTSEAATILQYGARLAAVGGYGIEASNGTNANYTVFGGFPGGSFLSKAIAVTNPDRTGEFLPVHTFFNWQDATSSLTGITDNVSEDQSWNYGGGTLSTDVPALFDIGLNARVGSGPSATNILNGTANINWKHHDIWCIAFDSVPTTSVIQAIVSEFYANPYEELVSIP